MLSVLCVGDIVGRIGREALRLVLPDLQREYSPDFTIVNLENASSGFGVTPKTYAELAKLPIDVFTSGNHIYDKRELLPEISKLDKLVRPLNFPNTKFGKGAIVVEKDGLKIAVVNAIGRVFMGMYDCPFRAMDAALPGLRAQTPVVIVDFHGEATSEKQAFGWYLDGRVSLVFGTHTHVPTADARILPEGTAYMSDIGMCGFKDGILGMQRKPIIEKFLTQLPTRFEPPKVGPAWVCGLHLVVDGSTGRAQSITPFQREMVI